MVVIAAGDLVTRKLVESAVENCGVEIAVAEDGEEALRLIQTRLPSLAVLAVSMPLRTGWEIGKALQADPRTSKIPIIFLTSHTQEKDVLEGYLSGATEYLFKPFSPSDLQGRVQAILDRT